MLQCRLFPCRNLFWHCLPLAAGDHGCFTIVLSMHCRTVLLQNLEHLLLLCLWCLQGCFSHIFLSLSQLLCRLFYFNLKCYHNSSIADMTQIWHQCAPLGSVCVCHGGNSRSLFTVATLVATATKALPQKCNTSFKLWYRTPETEGECLHQRQKVNASLASTSCLEWKILNLNLKKSYETFVKN